MRVVSTAAALIIGAELLSGKIRDENLHALAGTLRALGISLQRVVFCPDDKEEIAKEVRDLKRRVDVVFTSGGVGPTHDDVTIAGVAAALGVAVETNVELEALLRKIYGDRTSDAHLRMALVPEGARLAETTDIRWPTIVADDVWILPGVPELFRMKLATVRALLKGPVPFFTRELFCNIEETELKERLDTIVVAHPRVEVGSYPKWFDKRYKTRLTFDSRSEEDANRALEDATRLLSAHLVDLN